MKFQEIFEGDVVNIDDARQRRRNTDKWFKRTVTDAFPPDDIPEPLQRAAADLKASRAAVAAMDSPKASLSKLPLRSRDDIAKQVKNVLSDLDTKYAWVDEHTAMAHYNPADYVRAVNAFDQLFGDRQRTGRTAYIWHVDDVTITFTLETRKIIIEIE